jgi:neutral trehalase
MRVLFGKCLRFWFYDTLFNSVWSQANLDLAQIATLIGEVEDAKRWEMLGNRTRDTMNFRLWQEYLGVYQDYDLVGNRFITENVIAANFMPIYAAIPTENQLNAMFANWLNTNHFCLPNSNSSCYILPTLDTKSVNFSDHNYWRGPIWINMDWMLYNGLQKYNATGVPGLESYVSNLWNSMMTLITMNGMYEYFSPVDGQPHGTGNFSWTASLVIDLIRSRVK